MYHMKITFITLASLLISFSLSAQQTQSQKSVTPPSTVIKLATPADTLQYTLGAFFGQWLAKNGFAITNPAVFSKGLDDVLQNKKLIVTDTTIVRRIAAYQLLMQNERNRQLEEQLFAALKGKSGVGVLPDGVNYIIVKNGSGARPSLKDSIVINAIGLFPDGTVFEDTFKKKQPITTLTGTLIPGLNEAVQLMTEGSTWRIFIPSSLAYGPAGIPGVIPANSALVFDISLMEIKNKR